MSRRIFTPARARRAIDRLRPTLERIPRLFRTLEQHRPIGIESDQPVDPSYFKLVARMQGLLEEVRRSGAVVADVRHGRVGFPASRAGRRVLLCWRPEDDGLSWQDPGTTGRGGRPVNDNDPWDEP